MCNELPQCARGGDEPPVKQKGLPVDIHLVEEENKNDSSRIMGDEVVG